MRQPDRTTASTRQGYQAVRLLLVLVRFSVPRVPSLPSYRLIPSTDLPMRSLYLGNTMSSPSANPNPFARFALAATAAGGSRDASSFHPAPARSVDSSPAKKIRAALDGKPRDQQEPPKGLQEKYRYEQTLLRINGIMVRYDRPDAFDYSGRTLPSSFSATIVEARERTTTPLQQYQYHPPFCARVQRNSVLSTQCTNRLTAYNFARWVLCAAIGRGAF